MKCAFGLGSCKSEATHVATRKAGWQHYMNFDSLLMVKKRRKKTKMPCCVWHKGRLEEKYPDEYKFRVIESPIVTGPPDRDGTERS